MKILILLFFSLGAAAQTPEKELYRYYADSSCVLPMSKEMWVRSKCFGTRSGDVNLYMPTKQEKRLSRLEMIIAIPFVTFILIAVGSQYGKSVAP